MFHEPMPDCVPEYYRSKQEETDRRYELQTKQQKLYQANRQKIDAAITSGRHVLPSGGYAACWDCPDADHDTMTDAGDDTCRVICRNPACPQHQKEVSQ